MLRAELHIMQAQQAIYISAQVWLWITRAMPAIASMLSLLSILLHRMPASMVGISGSPCEHDWGLTTYGMAVDI